MQKTVGLITLAAAIAGGTWWWLGAEKALEQNYQESVSNKPHDETAPQEQSVVLPKARFSTTLPTQTSVDTAVTDVADVDPLHPAVEISTEHSFEAVPTLTPPSPSRALDSQSMPFDVDLSDAFPVSGDLIGGVIKQGDTFAADEFTQANDDYRFPAVVESDTGDWVMVIGDEPVPSRSSRRELLHGDGAVAEVGDTIRYRFDVFSWATGELVDSSRDLPDQSAQLTLGKLVGPNKVPTVLHNALLNRTAGSRIQVVLAQSLADLPEHLNGNDGFVVVVDIDDVLSSDEG